MSNYHLFTTINTPTSKRKKLDVGDIWLNQTTCLKCMDTITSHNRHDFKYCNCGLIGVDGGSWYAKRLYKDGAKYKDNIIMFKHPYK